MRGVTVTVLRPIEGPPDRFGNMRAAGHVRTEVRDVLVCPGDTSDADASRPDGVKVAFTLHFPKSWGGAGLRGCLVELPSPWGGTYRVVGDPKPYDAANTPTRWNMAVGVEAADG